MGSTLQTLLILFLSRSIFLCTWVGCMFCHFLFFSSSSHKLPHNNPSLSNAEELEEQKEKRDFPPQVFFGIASCYFANPSDCVSLQYPRCLQNLPSMTQSGYHAGDIQIPFKVLIQDAECLSAGCQLHPPAGQGKNTNLLTEELGACVQAHVWRSGAGTSLKRGVIFLPVNETV